jgi:MFS family permease
MRRCIKPEIQHYLGSFLLQTSHVVALTLIPFFTFQHLGGKERAAALVYGVQTLSIGATCFLSAPLVSKLRNGLTCCLIGAAGFGIFYCGAMFATCVWVFCVLAGIAMAFFALAWPAMQSWLGAQPDGKLRTRSFSYFNLSLGLGLTIGPLVAGAFYGINFRFAFLAVLVLSWMAAFLLFTLPREREYFKKSGQPDDPDRSEKASAPADTRNEVFLYCGWLTNMLGWGLTGAVRTVYAGQVNHLVQKGQLVLFSQGAPIHVFTSQQGPGAATLYTWMQAVLSLGYFAAILTMGRTVRWQHRFWLTAALECILGIGIWVLAGSRSLVVILICHATLGAFTAFGYMGSQCYSAANPQYKHRRIAINEGLAQSGGFAFPQIFAQLGTLHGLAWPFSYTPVLLVGFASLQMLSIQAAKWKVARRETAHATKQLTY